VNGMSLISRWTDTLFRLPWPKTQIGGTMEDDMISLEPDRLEVTPNAVGRTIQEFCAKS
jgi:hypothetical protein